MPNGPSIIDLTAELERASSGEHGIMCLKRSLRAAIQLEFSTIPPYLIAYWSTIDPKVPNAPNPVGGTIREIVVEEMGHMGLACNMLVALGESPDLASPNFVPKYPGPLPGHVNPELKIPLRRLTPSQLKVFMDIEYPDFPPFPELTLSARAFSTIGAFYAALLKAFESVNPPRYEINKQRDEGQSGVFKVNDLSDVRKAINQIRHQGEGSNKSPNVGDPASELAHFYRFREVFVGAKYVPDPISGDWSHSGPPISMPVVQPMADIPSGGYQQSNVPDSKVWSLIQQFDRTFTLMLKQLTLAWSDPSAPFATFEPTNVDDPINTMGELSKTAVKLMDKKRPDNLGNYGPCFRLV